MGFAEGLKKIEEMRANEIAELKANFSKEELKEKVENEIKTYEKEYKELLENKEYILKNINKEEINNIVYREYYEEMLKLHVSEENSLKQWEKHIENEEYAEALTVGIVKEIIRRLNVIVNENLEKLENNKKEAETKENNEEIIEKLTALGGNLWQNYGKTRIYLKNIKRGEMKYGIHSKITNMYFAIGENLKEEEIENNEFILENLLNK